MKNKSAVFKNKNIRRTWYKNDWWFSVVDFIYAINVSKIPKSYWNKMKARVSEEEKHKISTIYQPLIVKAKDGKKSETDCATTEGIFRLIQSIPSRNAEPFKRWIAKLGRERIEEIQNPEIAQERTKQLFEQKEGLKKQKYHAILTSEISKDVFRMTPSVYKRIKGLPYHDMDKTRNQMADLESIFKLFGESEATEIPKRVRTVYRKDRKGNKIERRGYVITRADFVTNVKRHMKPEVTV
jgi:prophage antirepressor-like protein